MLSAVQQVRPGNDAGGIGAFGADNAIHGRGWNCRLSIDRTQTWRSASSSSGAVPACRRSLHVTTT